MASKGRPKKLTAALSRTIFERIAQGESVNRLCADPDMPCKASFFNWLATDDDFLDNYQKAKAVCAHSMAEDVLEIADDARNDFMDSLDEDDPARAVYRLNSENIQRSRLRVDARLKLMRVLNPRSYGDRTTTELTGPGGGPIETDVSLNVTFVEP